MSETLRRAADRIRAWTRDPVVFVRDNFGAEPDTWQADVLRAFANATDPIQRRIAMKACAGPGKSTVMAWCAYWFLTCCAEKDQHPNGYALSVTGDNLRDNLWKELAKWRARSPFLVAAFEWTAETIYARDHQATWWLRARSWPKTADTEAIGRTLSGLHAKYIAYFADESGDIPPGVLRTMEQGLSNCAWGKILTGGNTTSQSGLLYLVSVLQRQMWTVFSITADPDDPRRTTRVDAAWAREQIGLWGRDNPWVMAFILGAFPPGAINALLAAEDIEAAMRRSLRDDAYSNVQKRLGIDVARFGDDSTVIFPRQGLRAFNPVQLRNARTTAIAGRIATGKAKWGSELELIDDTGGYAAGVIDQCLLGGIALVPVSFSGQATDPRYFNLRSEMYFRAAEWVKGGGWLPQLPLLVREGSVALYWYESGKLRVEEKAQIKKRLGYSPDHWDALLTTFALPDMPASMQSLAGIPAAAFLTQGRALTEWDPYADRQDYVGAVR